MYVFGGCTSTATTFNDLWRLDLTTHKWQRPPATGNYPSPKACAAMVAVNSADELEQEGPEGVPEKDDRRLGGQKLYLFGGWTHPSMFPLHRWRLFNELHSYDTETCRWTLEAPNDPLRPPTMAGHSATVHCGCIVVFGGLQKVRNSIGQFSSSSDVWTFDLKSECGGFCNSDDSASYALTFEPFQQDGLGRRKISLNQSPSPDTDSLKSILTEPT